MKIDTISPRVLKTVGFFISCSGLIFGLSRFGFCSSSFALMTEGSIHKKSYPLVIQLGQEVGEYLFGLSDTGSAGDVVKDHVGAVNAFH